VDFDYYQDAARTTDQFASAKDDAGLMIPLLGIAGETGTLLAEFKKKIRDGQSYEGFQTKAEEELGDILWYLTNITTRLNLSLSEVASKNLQKTSERWPLEPGQPPQFFDEEALKSERLPRVLTIRMFENERGRRAQMEIYPDGKFIGDSLSDNAYVDDGYRFHDVMHLAHMAVLGWSPVMRALLNLKRKSQPVIDEVEDGARAAILEELVIAFIYSNAKDRRYYENVKHVDTEMLGTIKRIVAHLEVRLRRTGDWENAILQGYSAFRYLLAKHEAVIELDLNKRTLKIIK
jgi:NTP pyrophosphatase (non-canonical NTP hydrolase)